MNPIRKNAIKPMPKNPIKKHNHTDLPVCIPLIAVVTPIQNANAIKYPKYPPVGLLPASSGMTTPARQPIIANARAMYMSIYPHAGRILLLAVLAEAIVSAAGKVLPFAILLTVFFESALPQFEQNLSEASISWPHPVQYILILHYLIWKSAAEFMRSVGLTCSAMNLVLSSQMYQYPRQKFLHLIFLWMVRF